MSRAIRRLMLKLRGRTAATLFEYAIILSIVSIAAVLVLRAIGQRANNMLEPVNAGFEQQP
jgi:Flp pilus assembly pilin Flp